MKKQVRVYEDPQTMKRFEGSALVLKVLRQDEPCSYCLVKFLAGPPPRTAERWIDNDQLH